MYEHITQVDALKITEKDYNPTRKSKISVSRIAASMSSFCNVRLFDFSAAPHARIDNSKMNTSQALANKTGAKCSQNRKKE